jgi:hypothetical protein
MELLFDRPPKDSLMIGEQTVHGGELFDVDDETGNRLLSNPAYRCRVPGPVPVPVPEPKPRGRRRIPDEDVPEVMADADGDVATQTDDVAAGEPAPELEPGTDTPPDTTD